MKIPDQQTTTETQTEAAEIKDSKEDEDEVATRDMARSPAPVEEEVQTN